MLFMDFILSLIGIFIVFIIFWRIAEAFWGNYRYDKIWNHKSRSVYERNKKKE